MTENRPKNGAHTDPSSGQPGKGHPSNGGHGDYEREDFTTPAIAGSLLGLIVMCVVSAFIVLGMYRYLDKSEMTPVAANPMVAAQTDTRHVAPGQVVPGKDADSEPPAIQAFPKPRLQDDDVKDMRKQLYGEESTLQSYGWVDQSAGEVRIPIERAMELMVERGLPERGAAATKVADAKVADAKMAAPAVAAHPVPARKATKSKAH